MSNEDFYLALQQLEAASEEQINKNDELCKWIYHRRDSASRSSSCRDPSCSIALEIQLLVLIQENERNSNNKYDCQNEIFLASLEEDERIIVHDDNDTTTATTVEPSPTIRKRSVWIVYSHVWKGPVLYMDHCWGDDKKNDDDYFIKNNIPKEMIVSHELHPWTGFPAWVLHSCQVQDQVQQLLLQELCNKTATPIMILLSWMSIVLPQVGIRQYSSSFYHSLCNCKSSGTS